MNKSDLSFNSEKIHMIFSSQKRMDNFCAFVFEEKDLLRYRNAIEDDRKSPCQVFQDIFSQRLGLDLIGKENTVKGTSLDVDVIDNVMKLGFKRIEDSMCVMFFSDAESMWLRESIHERLDQSIIAEFPAEAQDPPLLQDMKNILLFNPIGTGESEAKLCLAILHSLTFVKVDGDLIQSVEDIERRIWGKKYQYELVKERDYHLTISSNSIFFKWKNHLRNQKILLDGVISRFMPFPPFTNAPRSEFHEWLDNHCKHISTLDYTPSELVQNSLNRICWLKKIGKIIAGEHNQKDCSYDIIVNNSLEMKMEPPNKKWEVLHEELTNIYRSNQTKNHVIFSGLPHIQRRDSGFEIYSMFDDWTLKDREQAGLLTNLSPKYWRHFHFLNLAIMMEQKYKEKIEMKPDSNQEMEILNAIKVHGFKQHNYWIQTLQEFRKFSEAGGRLT